MAKKTVHFIFIWLPLIAYIIYNINVHRTPGYDYAIAAYEMFIAVILYAYFLPPHHPVNKITTVYTAKGHTAHVFFARVPHKSFTWMYQVYIYDKSHGILICIMMFRDRTKAINWAKSWEK